MTVPAPTPAALELDAVVGRSALGSLGTVFPISLSLAPGACGVVLGGKETSSLFRLVMGSGELDAGEIRVAGARAPIRRGTRASDQELAAWRQRIGFAFREKGLISNLTLLENVDLPAKYHGLYKPGVPKGSLAAAALEELEVDAEVWHLRPNRISWEIRKKVLFARSIVLDPPVLLMDDPSAFVATPWLPFLLRWITLQRKKGRAILIGTNDYPFGLAAGDWVMHPVTGEVTTAYSDFIDAAWIEVARLLRAQAGAA